MAPPSNPSLVSSFTNHLLLISPSPRQHLAAMVSLSAIQASNANIASALPAGLVAVFVGATSGIGETALKQFARHTRQPRIYFVGRSDEAGKRVADECRSLNKDGQYNFVRADVGLIRSVDDVCRDITAKETAINLLFLTPGTMVSHTGKMASAESQP